MKKGDHTLMQLVGTRLEVMPASRIPRDQLWFWTPEWQSKEREADQDIAQGRVKDLDSVEALLQDLRS